MDTWSQSKTIGQRKRERSQHVELKYEEIQYCGILVTIMLHFLHSYLPAREEARAGGE